MSSTIPILRKSLVRYPSDRRPSGWPDTRRHREGCHAERHRGQQRHRIHIQMHGGRQRHWLQQRHRPAVTSIPTSTAIKKRSRYQNGGRQSSSPVLRDQSRDAGLSPRRPAGTRRDEDDAQIDRAIGLARRQHPGQHQHGTPGGRRGEYGSQSSAATTITATKIATARQLSGATRDTRARR